MFSDQLFFHGSPARLSGLATRPARAQSFRVECPKTALLRTMPVSLGPQAECFFTSRNGGACSQYNYGSDAPAAEEDRDLFSPGRHASENGKEGTPC